MHLNSHLVDWEFGMQNDVAKNITALYMDWVVIMYSCLTGSKSLRMFMV